MLTLNNQIKATIIDLRAQNENETALEVIEAWLLSLENKEDKKVELIDDATSEFLHQQLYTLALDAPLFERATRALGKIFAQEPDEENKDFENYKALFNAKNTSISLSVKQTLLTALMDPEANGGAHPLAFILIEQIFPNEDKLFAEELLRLLIKIVPFESQNVYDFMLDYFPDWLQLLGLTEALLNLIQTMILNQCAQMDPEDEALYAQYENEIGHFAIQAASMISKELLVKAFSFCKDEVLVEFGISHAYAKEFLAVAFQRFPNEFAQMVSDSPSALVKLSVLLNRVQINTNNGIKTYYNWSDIGLFMLRTYASSEYILAGIANVIATLDVPEQMDLLCTLAKSNNGYPSEVQSWAKKALMDCYGNTESKRDATLVHLVQAPVAKKLKVLTQWPMFTQESFYEAHFDEHVFNFKEITVPADNDCAFHATGFNRVELNETLKLHSNDEALRNRFVVEIREYFVTRYYQQLGGDNFDAMISGDKIMFAIHQLTQLQDKLDDLHRRVGDANPVLREQKKTVHNHPDEFPDSEDKKNWLATKDLEMQCEKELTELLSSPEIFNAYLNHSATTKIWCSGVALTEYARIKGIHLCIWKREKRDANQLIIEGFNGNIKDPGAVHLHFKFGHYDSLVVAGSPVNVVNAMPVSNAAFKM